MLAGTEDKRQLAMALMAKAKGERRGTESVRTEMDGFVVLVVNI